MEFRQLECFCAAGELENFSRAAERIHISQPALSSSIQALEQEIGISLFLRHGKHIQLSPWGRKLLPQAQKILQERNAFLAQCSSNTKSAAVRLYSPVASALLPEIIHGFRREQPEIELIILQQDCDDADLILDAIPEQNLGAMDTVLLQESIVLATPAGHVLADRKSISLQELENESMISLRRGQHLREQEELIFQQAGIHPKRSVECDSPHTLRQLLSHGLGLSLVPQLSWQSIQGENLRFIPISWPHCSRCIVVRVEQEHAEAMLLRDYLIRFFADYRKTRL